MNLGHLFSIHAAPTHLSQFEIVKKSVKTLGKTATTVMYGGLSAYITALPFVCFLHSRRKLLDTKTPLQLTPENTSIYKRRLEKLEQTTPKSSLQNTIENNTMGLANTFITGLLTIAYELSPWYAAPVYPATFLLYSLGDYMMNKSQKAEAEWIKQGFRAYDEITT